MPGPGDSDGSAAATDPPAVLSVWRWQRWIGPGVTACAGTTCPEARMTAMRSNYRRQSESSRPGEPGLRLGTGGTRRPGTERGLSGVLGG